MFWYEKSPELLEDVKQSLKKSGRSLRLKKCGGKYIISGVWDVIREGELLESYVIKIVFPDNYPEKMPSVYEVSEKIPRSADRHLMSTKFGEIQSGKNWEACLFVSYARWEIWPIGESFKIFLDKPLNDFFFSQIYFEKFKKWPFGDYSHGDKGILEYLSEKLGTSDRKRLSKMINIINLRNTPRSEKCPCGSKKRAKHCHGTIFDLLRTSIPKIEKKSI